MDESPNVQTVAAYDEGASEWVALSANSVGPAKQAFFDGLTHHAPPPQSVLEVGSGSGRDADWLEQQGYTVTRTDASGAFVAGLREQGRRADKLNVLTDPLPSGFGVVYASAVFLHFTPAEFARVLRRLSGVVGPGGWLAFTVKEGEGQEWSTAKIGRRYFQYWQEPSLREVLDASPWEVVALEARVGMKDTWLGSLCRLPSV